MTACDTSLMGRIFGHKWIKRTWSITGGGGSIHLEPPTCLRCGYRPGKAASEGGDG